MYTQVHQQRARPIEWRARRRRVRDEYQLEEVELGAGGDYIIPSYANFSAEWIAYGVDRLQLRHSHCQLWTVSNCCKFHCEILNRNPLAVQSIPHQPLFTLCNYQAWLLAGRKVLVRSRMTYSSGKL
ncbi:hypothetical protein JB92DRAFT_1359146 [Gautieria morchelliformis]|nr:hypothetical protein JB92DRAFT_1359146 [Gautieria morchelliformis]